jgi:hypothetical protein
MQLNDTTTANAVLKELYDGQIPEEAMYKKSPFFAMVDKKTDFGGRNYPIPIEFAVGQGRSSDFATAQANQSANQFVEFLLTRVPDYWVGSVSNELLLAAETDRESFIRYATNLINGGIKSAVASIGSSLFRSGTGSIGQIASISSGVITFIDPQMVTQFERNMTLQANATDGGTPRAALGYVIARNGALGTITVSATFGGSAGNPTGWTTNDFLLVQGDNNKKMKGLAAWCPATAPTTGDSFFGVDRSVDSRLYGLYQDLSNESIEEALVDADALLDREGGEASDCIVTFTTFGALKKALGTRIEYIDLKGPANISFRGIVLQGNKREIHVWPDKDCQPQTAWLLTMSTWKLCTLMEAPMILRYGSNDDMLRVYNADSAEVRIGMYGNLGCSFPGANMQVKVAV